MNKNARKLIPAVAMLLVSATMLSTASFAWFSMNTRVSATGMQVNVNAPGSILISTQSSTANTSDWGSSIELDGGDAATPDAITLGHVSSTNGGDNSFFTINPGSIDAEGNPTSSAQVVAVDAETYASEQYGVSGTVPYVDYVFYLATTAATNMNITLDVENTAFRDSEGGEIDNSNGTASQWDDPLANALRFAVLTGENEVPGVGNVWLGPDNSTTETENSVYTSAGAATGDSSPASKGSVNQFTENDQLLTLTGTGTEGTTIGTPVKVTIRIWLEGTDAEAVNENIVTLTSYTLNVSFTQVAVGG